MAVSMDISGRSLGRNTCPAVSTGQFVLATLPTRKTGQPEHVPMQKVLKYRCSKKITNIRPYKVHRLHAVRSSTSSSNTMPSDSIEQFYNSINEKNLKELGKFISNDCFYDDFSFPKPFRGRKEILKFFDQLTRCMGDNIKFNVGNICEGAEGDLQTVLVNWHLDWKKIQIPFTRGCSLYELSNEGERLVIKKAQVVIESPFKPGALALILLKIVTTLFDTFPEAAQWFLQSPHFILLKIYSVAIAPFIRPLLAFYINLWKLMVLVLNLALKIYIQISKKFRK